MSNSNHSSLVAALLLLVCAAPSAQQLVVRADQLVIEPPTAASCAQIGIYLNSTAASGMAWDVMSVEVMLDADLDILIAQPALVASDFAATSVQQGIRSPGVPVPGSNCSASAVTNVAVEGGPSADFMRGANDPSARSMQSSNINGGSMAARIIAIDADSLLQTDDTEHLVALIELPLVANPRRGGRVRVLFETQPAAEGNSLKTLGGATLVAAGTAGELLIAGGPVFTNGFEGDQ